MARTTIIAEIGCNHMGDAGLAFDMVETVARFCKADVAKFQKRTPTELLTPKQYAAPHPNPDHAYGSTYGEHREALELPIDVHAELKARCEQLGIGYMSSVWDLTSAREVMSLEPAAIKIPSSQNDNWELLGLLVQDFPGEIHVSLGMITRSEEAEVVRFLAESGRLGDTVLYACTAGYPITDDEACLLEVTRLIESYGDRVAGLGYSGHHNGIAIDMGAITLGAQWLERHFTLDRTFRGTDHAASLEPDGLRRLKRDSVALSNALAAKPSDAMLEVEVEQRLKLKGRPAGVAVAARPESGRHAGARP